MLLLARLIILVAQSAARTNGHCSCQRVKSKTFTRLMFERGFRAAAAHRAPSKLELSPLEILPRTSPLRPHDRGDAGRASSRATDERRRPGAPVPRRRTADERELVVGGPRGGVGTAPTGRSGRGAARRHGPEASWSYLTIFRSLLPLLRLRRRRLEEPQDRPRRRPERRDPLGVGHPGLDAVAAHRHVPI